MDDATLYQRVMAGDEGALEMLVDRYHAPIYRFLHRQTNDPALADDLTQETFTRLLTYTGEPPTRFKPWAYTIARNLAYDHYKSAAYRRERSTDFTEPLHQQHSGDQNPEAAVLQLGTQERISAALAQLPDAQREVVILRFYHEMNAQEISDVIGAPASTIRGRLFYALKKLKGLLMQEAE